MNQYVVVLAISIDADNEDDAQELADYLEDILPDLGMMTAGHITGVDIRGDVRPV